MEQYIPKSVLIAEIERIQNEFSDSSDRNGNFDDLENQGAYKALDRLESSLDTLEVKEVNLEKEIDKFYGMYRKNGKTYSTEDNEECLDWKVDCNPNFEKAFAKHFFELGMQLSNKTLKRE